MALLTGLEAAWNMSLNATTGTLESDLVNTHSLTYTNIAANERVYGIPRAGWANRTDGVNGRLSVANSEISAIISNWDNAWSMSLILRVKQTVTDAYILNRSGTSAGENYFAVKTDGTTGNNLAATLFGGTEATGTATIDDGNPHEIFVVFDGVNTLNVYVDGNATPDISATGGADAHDQAQDIYIGGRSNASSFLRLDVAEFCIWSAAVSTADITSKYNAGSFLTYKSSDSDFTVADLETDFRASISFWDEATVANFAPQFSPDPSQVTITVTNPGSFSVVSAPAPWGSAWQADASNTRTNCQNNTICPFSGSASESNVLNEEYTVRWFGYMPTTVEEATATYWGGIGNNSNDNVSVYRTGAGDFRVIAGGKNFTITEGVQGDFSEVIIRRNAAALIEVWIDGVKSVDTETDTVPGASSQAHAWIDSLTGSGNSVDVRLCVMDFWGRGLTDDEIENQISGVKYNNGFPGPDSDGPSKAKKIMLGLL